MSTQIPLLTVTVEQPAPATWQLDDQTRAIGRQGLTQAREALRQAQARQVVADRPAA